MSNISQQRLIEMEAEMDRFEQEILAQDAGDIPKVIIGSSTYNQVAAQLKMLRAASEQSRSAHHQQQQQQQPHHHHHEEQNDDSDDDHDYDADRSCQLDRDEPPPKKSALDMPLLPPPPPPPIATSTPFVPHQIRHRAPGPRPGSQSGPPRMRPPMNRPPYGGGPMSGPGHPGPGGPPGRYMSGPPRPGYGPMGGPGPGPYGPGSGPPRGPMGPGMGMQGPHHMGGHMENQGGGLYGVSKGDSHAYMNEEKKKEPEEDKPKVIYASAPVITKQKEPKKKKKKKKKLEPGSSEGKESASETPVSTKDVTKDIPTVTMPPMGASAVVEPEPDDFHVADMEIDNPYHVKKEKKEKKKKFVRMAAGQTWEDQSLAEWENDDFRLFCGDLGNEVTDEVLARAFSKYPSFGRSKVIRDKRTNKTKGYGFVSFKDPNDYVRAMREMNGKYVGNRPIKLRKSSWKDRNIDSVKKKEKEKKRLGLR